MNKIRVFLFILCILLMPSNAVSKEVRWVDFRNPLLGPIRVCHNDSVKISVNLPSDFLSQDEILLSITVASETGVERADGFVGFEGMQQPGIGVNGSFLRTYYVPVKDSPAIQSHDIKIKRKHLKTGGNVLKFSFRSAEGYYCIAPCCSYIITHLSFPSGSTTVQQQNRNAEFYGKRGTEFGKKGQFDKALSDFNKAIEINPRDPRSYNNRGITYNIMHQFDKAISDFNKAIEINPRNARAYSNRGVAYKNKGRYDKAISDFTLAIRANSKYADAYYHRAYTYYLKKDYHRALDDVHKAQGLGFQVNPKFLKALREASRREK